MDKFGYTERKWVIMNQDKTVIAKGVPRNRELILVDDKTDKKRVLTYNSKKKAEAGFLGNWFWDRSGKKLTKKDMEAVEVEITIKEI